MRFRRTDSRRKTEGIIQTHSIRLHVALQSVCPYRLIQSSFTSFPCLTRALRTRSHRPRPPNNSRGHGKIIGKNCYSFSRSLTSTRASEATLEGDKMEITTARGKAAVPCSRGATAAAPVSRRPSPFGASFCEPSGHLTSKILAWAFDAMRQSG